MIILGHQATVYMYCQLRQVVRICKLFDLSYTVNKGIHLYLPSTLWAEFLSQCEDISLSIWFSGLDCDSHVKGKNKHLQYIPVWIFFSNFGHLFSPFNPVFYFHYKNINFFEIGPKLTFLRCFFHGTIFFAQEFLLS